MRAISRRAAFLSSLLLLPLLFSMSGCHGSRGLDEFAIPEEFDEGTNYEITFWAKNDTNKAQSRIYEQAAADFHELYPNVTVNLRLYTDYGRIYNDVITNISTQTTPNVCITYPDHIATYRTGVNVVVPLDGLMADPRWGLGGSEMRFESPSQAEIVPEYLAECAFDGHYYALPYMRSTEACYINRDYVEALGYTVPDVLTWDFIWEVSDAAAAKSEDGTYLLNGQKVMIPFIYKSTDNMMIQMLRQKGADYSTDAGEIGIFSGETEELLYTVRDHVQSGAFSTFKISSYPANFLNAGQCVFAIDSTAGATWMGTDAPLSDIAADKIVRFETAVRPVPQFDPEHPQMISQGPSVCIFNKADPGEVLASWLFTQYLLTNGVQIAYAETEGYVPVTTAAQNDPEYQAYLNHPGDNTSEHYTVKLEASRMLIERTPQTFVTPVFNGSASLRDAASQLIENVAKSVKRKETVDDAYMRKLFSDVNALYRLDQKNLSAGEKTDPGPLPPTAVCLLAALALTWIGIGIYVIPGWVKKRKTKST